MKQTLDILLCLRKMKKLRRSNFEFGPIRRHKGPGYLPSLLCQPREFGPPMRQRATTVVHFLVIWITVLLLVLWPITRRDLWRLWYFHNKNRSGGYLSHGWEGIRGSGPSALPASEMVALGSGALAGDNHGQQSLSPPCLGSVYFRLMCKWKNKRRLRNRCSRLGFIISSGGTHSFWPW